MSSKPLYMVAKELGMQTHELEEKIIALGLSFTVKNHLTKVTLEQCDELKRALERIDSGKREEAVVQAGVKRRRSAAKPEAAAAVVDEPAAPSPASVSPAPAEPRAPVPAPEPPPETTAATEVAAPAAPARRRKISTVTTRPEAARAPSISEPPPAPAEEPAAHVESAGAAEVADAPIAPPAPPTEEQTGARRRSRFATVVTRSEPVVPPPAPAIGHGPDASASAAPPAAAAPERRSRFATVHTRPQGEQAVAQQPSPLDLAALARREADRASAARTSGARVVGTVNPDLLNLRLDPDRRDGGAARPGAPPKPGEADKSARDKKGVPAGKRVIQSRELYDKFKRTKKKAGVAPIKGAGPVAAPAARTAEHKRVVRMGESVTVAELAHQLGVKGGEIAMKLMFDLGVKGANINTTIDVDTATLIAELYDWKVEKVGFDVTQYLPTYNDNDETMSPRSPVVTVMGHVDHGKTSLLDAIRKTAVAAGEHGGITQHIGAYTVTTDQGTVCFLDTPGHEAFTALRARGAQATDLVILVVAADDGVMPQTVEAIHHAREAEVPIIVAVNKIDKQGANPERVRQALTEHSLVPEDWGGDTIFVDVSAKQGTGLDRLIEMVHLQAEVLELRANATRSADGLVIESKLDTGRGPVATVLVQGGTLKVGDIVVIGQHFGRVRTMTDEWGQAVRAAVPSTPVEITGLSGVPDSGEHFYVVAEEKDARVIADYYQAQTRAADLAVSAGTGGTGAIGMERIAEMLKAGAAKELKVIVKGDVQGSVEAINDALRKLATEKVAVKVIHSAVGGITETDVNLASSAGEGTGAVILGFNVRPEARATALAEQLGVHIELHNIIYEIIDLVRGLMTGLLEPVYKEESVGRAEVRKTFNVPKVGLIAGCFVLDGVVQRGCKARVVRNSRVVYESSIASLRHFEKDEREVRSGFECGLTVERFNDVKVGDLIECYKTVETAATL